MGDNIHIYQSSIFILIIQTWITFVEGTTCFQCNNLPYASNVSSCSHTVKCADNQICSTSINIADHGRSYYRSGCTDSKLCNQISSGDPGLVGKRDIAICISCCLGDKCNTHACNLHQSEVCSDWENWASCDVTCGGGKQLRHRQCKHTSQQTISNEARPCNTHACAAEACKDQYKDCSTPEITKTICPSPTMAKQYCAKTCGHCPINGQWSQWSHWSGCTATCGNDAHKLRLRMCNNPEPKNNGAYCSGPDKESSPCPSACPVDGDWSSWTTWSSCSHTCGNGIKNRYRACSNPRPAHGGKQCTGSNYDSSGCRDVLCQVTVDGGWSGWSHWTACSATCGTGKSSRFRTCSNPVPKNGGKPCENPAHFSDAKPCKTNDCPVDGHWADWSPWHQCSVTCGGGNSFRSRSCSNPVPRNGGKACENPASFIQHKPCGEDSCSAQTHVFTSQATTTLASHIITTYSSSIQTHAHSLVPAVGCNDVEFCSDTHIRPLVCQDAYMATTYCPKMCGLCGATNTPAPCEDSVGGSCNDPLYTQFACNDNELAALCAKTCGVCH